MIRRSHLLAIYNLIDSILASPQILNTYPFYRLYDYFSVQNQVLTVEKRLADHSVAVENHFVPRELILEYEAAYRKI